MLRPTSKLSTPGGGNFECYFNNHRGNPGRDSPPETASGWIFPNTIGGALDLDNLADRIIKPVLRGNGPQWKGWHAYRRGLADESQEARHPGHRDPSDLASHGRWNDTAVLHQDRPRRRERCHETA
jgi:hypothetical protein